MEKTYRTHLMVCAGTGCVSNKSFKIKEALERELKIHNLSEEIQIVMTGCNGFCAQGPIMVVWPEGIFYNMLKEEDIPNLVIEHFLKGRPVGKLMFTPPTEKEPVPLMKDIGFFAKQRLIALRNRGIIDPEKIDEYIARDGYKALARALGTMAPGEIVSEIKKSGLRGRGGAGFPTGLKWEFCRKQQDETKYVVCNGDEGDPGAFMDRSIIESDPHSVLEGMAIGARAIGARHGYIYIRNEYPLAVKRMLVAMEAAREYGLLGENILGSNFSFDVDLKKGAGAFVCGEETSLMASIEGRPPEPRQRPPYPVELGIWDKPTNINNVETWATVPEIINKGADWFSSIGTETSKGTKVFSLVGKVKNTGLVEVPMGISLKEIVFDIGGGIIGDKKFKAVQTGGPSGGCLPKSLLELPIDYEKLAEAGSIMGSGGMIVMDEDTCMVDVARYFLDFLREESCGKCTSCRDGIEAMYECINDICEGRGKEQDIALLEELASAVKDASQCGLGQTASNPVLSTLRYFRNEYERHIVDKRCDAFVCKKLVGAPCQSACPLGTEAWRYIALLEKGRYKEAYEVIRQTNPFPSVCARVCDHRCETRCRLGTSGGEPVAIRALKRVIADTMGDYAHKPAKPAPGRDIKVAVVGAGPAGLSAAHYLSVNGYTVTVFDAESEAGGMLISSIPAYRLPREAVRKEIKALMNENMTLKCSTLLGRDITIDSLFEQGFKAIFLALGAHESLRLGLEGEDAKGVYPSMRFLKAYNLRNEALARGNVGVIGGGNSAVDAARVALRQKGVESVTILYRRTRQEMPAYKEEIDAALEEGIRLDTLVTPVRVLSENGGLTGIKCIRNNLGDVDSSGRRRPVPIPGSEFDVPLDILIVAISERPEKESVASLGLNSERDGRLRIDPSTFSTSRQGVFAGGDIVTGPSTVVDAIAAGMKTAGVIDRYLQGKELRQPPELKLPDVFIEPVPAEEIKEDAKRAHPRTLSVQSRKGNFAEVEMTFTMAEAVQETRRCLRCDLEFTQQPKEKEQEAVADKAGAAVN